MANKLYPKTKAKLMKALLDLSSVTVKAVLVETNYAYSDSHQFLSDVPSAYQIAIGPALAGVVIGANDASFQSNNPLFTAVTGSSAGEHANSIILFHDTGAAGTSDLIGYFDTGVTGLPFVPDGGDREIVVPVGGWFTL
jgi:hypothetical protein